MKCSRVVVTAIHRRRISCGLESLSVKCSRVVFTAIHRRRISCGLESLSVKCSRVVSRPYIAEGLVVGWNH